MISDIVHASFRVSHLIANEGKCFGDGEFVKQCIAAVVEELMPKKEKVFEEIIEKDSNTAN